MITNMKLREDSSRAIFGLLVNVLESCRQGDVHITDVLGLDIDVVRKLDQLKPDQVNSLAGIYMRDRCPLEIFNLDGAKLGQIIDLASERSLEQKQIDQYIKNGACKKAMNELFGLRSTQLASLKKFLNVSTQKGRLPVVTQAEERQIYDEWLDRIEMTDYRQRILDVGLATGIPLSQVYRVVQEIEEIENQKANKENDTKRYA